MFNDFLNIVANDYRRRLLIALLEHDRREETDRRLPDDIATTDAARDKQVAELRHCHLPMLTRSELIEWEPETNTVAKGPRFDDIRPLLEVLATQSDELPDKWISEPITE